MQAAQLFKADVHVCPYVAQGTYTSHLQAVPLVGRLPRTVRKLWLRNAR